MDSLIKIHTVLFDYGGVIAEEGFREGLQAIGSMNGYDPVIFYKEVNRIIADCGYLTGHADEGAFWAAVRRTYRLAQPDALLREEILRRFILRPNMLSVVAGLREKKFPVGIISDQTNWLDELNSRDGFFPCFDIIFNSFHLHASKYHGDLFSAVAEQLQAPPGQVLIVDDNGNNIAKARQQGYAAIHFIDESGFLEELQAWIPGRQAG